ncbi:MAG: response regulator [Ferruginibacter sp.]
MKKILLIESNQSILENFTEYFEKEGFEIISARNGTTGVAMARKCEPDLIISEIQLHGIDGYEVLRLIIKKFSTSCIPFIFCTTKCEAIDKTNAMDLGADDFIVKPVSLELLNVMANTWITAGSRRPTCVLA